MSEFKLVIITINYNCSPFFIICSHCVILNLNTISMILFKVIVLQNRKLIWWIVIFYCFWVSGHRDINAISFFIEKVFVFVIIFFTMIYYKFWIRIFVKKRFTCSKRIPWKKLMKLREYIEYLIDHKNTSS